MLKIKFKNIGSICPVYSVYQREDGKKYDVQIEEEGKVYHCHAENIEFLWQENDEVKGDAGEERNIDYVNETRTAVMKCMDKARSVEDFIARMMTLGYQTKWRERGTYITFANSNNQKVRNSRIDISKEEILKKFEENSKRSKSEIDICEQLEIKRNAASKNKDIFVYTFSRNCQQCHTVNELLTYMVFDDDTDENLVFPWDRERLFSSQDAISFFKHMLYEESEYYSYQVLGENKKLDQLMLKKFPETIRMEYSKTLKEKYAMNICPKCNGVGMGKHGKNFLHVLLDQKIKNMEKIKVIDVLELSQY